MNAALPNSRLSIPGLPPIFDDMVAGGLYAINSSSPPVRSALILHALSAAVQDSATLISAADPERLLLQARSIGLGDLDQALAGQRLRIFQLKEGSSKNVFRHGATRLTRELNHLKVGETNLVLFDTADELFTLQDPMIVSDQISVYQDWIRQQGRCGLLLFSQLFTNAHFASSYNTMLNHLAGAVHVESGPQGLEWEVDFWSSPSGMVASRTLAARVEPNGQLRISATARELVPDTAEAAGPAEDEDAVFTTDSTLAGMAAQARGNWTFSDNLVALMHAARNAKAATVLLVFDRDSELRTLAQAVHMLRVSLGKRVRIVVRELNASLRYQNELLLLRLGANMILNRDMPTTRLQLSLASLKGQIFNREIDLDFDNALASVAPTKAVGALPPHTFLNECQRILEHSRELDVPCSLIRFTLEPDEAEATAMARFNLTRAGDLATAQGGFLYIFLSACPQASVLPTLRRMAGDSMDKFASVEFAFHEADTNRLLVELEHRLNQMITKQQWSTSEQVVGS